MKAKKKIIIAIILLIIITVGGILIYKNYKDNKVPELKKLYVFGKKIKVVKGKRVYRIILDKDYRTKKGDKCETEFAVTFDEKKSYSNSRGIQNNGIYQGETFHAYYIVDFNIGKNFDNDTTEYYDYYIDVYIKNPNLTYDDGCNEFVVGKLNNYIKIK